MNDREKKFIPDEDVYLFNTGCARKAWLCFGCRYIPELGAHRFVVWAPNAQRVSLVGDFNSWDRAATPMECIDGGVWVCFVEGLSDGVLYKFCVTGADGHEILKSDPFAAWSEHGENTASRVWKGGSYKWTDESYMSRRAARDFMREPMSIYELHPGSWRELSGKKPAYRELADSLAVYCKHMGFTHVELMPITEYPYDGSWGYQVTGYYAPTSRYGNPDDFKYLVDKLHHAGIGVIMDWVPAHFPKDEHGLANFDGTPLFECKERRMAEHPEWGTLVFDYASDQVQSFLVSSACKFFEEYHIDGIRVDAVSSMLYLDYGRRPGEFTPNRNGGNINLDAVAFLQKLNSTVLVNYPGAVTIAEESTAFPKISSPPEDGGLGFCFKWDMGFMHDTLDYMSMDPLYRSHHHDKLTFSMMYAFSENYVLAYSHDEVVHCKKSMIDKMFGDYDQKFSSLRALYGYQFAHPGKKLIFMGGEFGQFIEWNWQQELDWLLLEYDKHKKMQYFVKTLNRFYLENPEFWQIDYSWEGFSWISNDDRDQSVISFRRIDKNGDEIICVFNFVPVARENYRIGAPQHGIYSVLFNTDDEKFGGSGTYNESDYITALVPMHGYDQSLELKLPPLSALFLKLKRKLPVKHIPKIKARREGK